MKTKKILINVCGAGRSGTTMLDMMIGNSPNAYSLGEVYAWFRPWRKHHFAIDCACGENPCPKWSLIKDLKESRFHAEAFKRLDVELLVDSSKELAWVLDTNHWAKNHGFKVFNIALYKDPLHYIYSHWKRGRSVKIGRQMFVDYYSRFLQLKIPFFSVHYDTLCKDPGGSLSEIGQITGTEYFEGKERFWEKRHHHIFGSLGTKQQIGKKNGSIRVVKEYDSDFEKQMAAIQAENERDKRLSNVIAQLAKHHMKEPASLHNGKIRRPYWYYLLRINSKLKSIRHSPRTLIKNCA